MSKINTIRTLVTDFLGMNSSEEWRQTVMLLWSESSWHYIEWIQFVTTKGKKKKKENTFE